VLSAIQPDGVTPGSQGKMILYPDPVQNRCRLKPNSIKPILPVQHSHPPTHEEIAQRARSIWNMHGQPQGHDTAIWLEAEWQLSIDLAGPQGSGSVAPTSSPGPMGRVLSSPKTEHAPAEAGFFPAHYPATTVPDPDVMVAKSALAKKSARAALLPTHKNAPQPAPTESGKPLWNQPHSS